MRAAAFLARVSLGIGGCHVGHMWRLPRPGRPCPGRPLYGGARNSETSIGCRARSRGGEAHGGRHGADVDGSSGATAGRGSGQAPVVGPGIVGAEGPDVTFVVAAGVVASAVSAVTGFDDDLAPAARARSAWASTSSMTR